MYSDTIETTDNELLMLFARQGDENAFRQLVERHAALVMNVCRRITRDEQDAEDAFQATLLILARRAGRLLHVTSLGGWLHRVAYRTSLRAGRKREKQRESRLVEEPAMNQEDALQQIHVREIQRVLHEELRQIPGRYRNAIVLCDLEGKTRRQAAQHLDCTEPAIKAALARGRRQLRSRLLKRGVALSIAFVMTNEAIASESVVPLLLEKAMTLCVRQPSQNEVLSESTSVQSLAREGVILMTHSSTMRAVVAVTSAAALIVGPLVLLGQIVASPDRDGKSVVVAQSRVDDVPPRLAQVPVSGNTTESEDAKIDPQEQTARNKQLAGLRNELIETLQQLVSATSNDYRAGRTSLETLIRTRLKLSDALLAVARTQSERLHILEERLENFRALERTALVKREEGILDGGSHLSIKAERLEAELALLREQDVRNPESPLKANSSDAGAPSVGDPFAKPTVPLNEYVLSVGDVLGIYIKGVLGAKSIPSPIIPNDPTLPPAVGFPIPILGDGNIHVPLVAPIQIEGSRLSQVVEAIRTAYTIDNKILTPDDAQIVVTLMRRTSVEVKSAFKAKIGPGDVLGIFVDGVIGNRDDIPLVNLPKGRAFGPAIGIPFIVLPDGTVDLPLVGRVLVGGMQLHNTVEVIRSAYTVRKKILRRADSVILVTLLHSGS